MTEPSDPQRRPLSDNREIARLQAEVIWLKKTVGTLIAWISQSSASPIRRDEGMQLLRMLEGDDL